MAAVYAITHLPSGTVYVGATSNEKLRVKNTKKFGYVEGRFAEHLGLLNDGKHYNKHLQGVWAESQDDFEFQVLERVSADENVFDFETAWVSTFPSVFNINKARRDGKQGHIQRLPVQTRAKIAELLYAGTRTGEQIARMTGVSTATVSNIRKDLGLPRGTYFAKKVQA
jgi:hypothetical protein